MESGGSGARASLENETCVDLATTGTNSPWPSKRLLLDWVRLKPQEQEDRGMPFGVNGSILSQCLNPSGGTNTVHFFLLLLLPPLIANANVDLQVYTSLDSPQLLSTVVSLAAVTDVGSAGNSVWYRFRARAEGNDYRIIRDFGPLDSLDWTVYEQEGIYEIEVTAQAKATGETATKSVVFEWFPVATDQEVINQTQHPLVYLFSVPPCDRGSVSWVPFTSTAGLVQQTPPKGCDGARTMNFLIAGVV